MESLAADIDALKRIDPDLGKELDSFTSLEHVLTWLPKRGIDFAAIDMVTQDEFCHDLTVPLHDGRVVSFGMT